MKLPLTGRATELAAVLDVLKREPAEAVAFVGPAGVGKTRLAREIVTTMRGEGVTCVTIVGSRAARCIPLGAMAGLLVGDPPGQSPFALLQAARRALAEQAGGAPTLLFVDDAQLLDDVSATLVQQVVATQVCPVLLTIRSGETIADPLAAAWRGGWTQRFELGALGEGDSRDLLCAALDGPVDDRTARLFHQRSAGNALYLTELVRAAADADALRAQDGVWRLDGPLQVPSALIELVDARLSQLDQETRQALEVTAVAECIGLAMLEAVTPGTAIDVLEEQRLIEIEQDGRRAQARVAHPIYGEAVCRNLPVRRARRIRLMLAERLESVGTSRRGDALRIALWRLEAGVPGDSAILARAADEAAARADWPLTERIATAAWEEGAGVSAGIRIAESAFKRGGREEALAWFQKLLPLAADDGQRSDVIDGMAYVLGNQMGRHSEAVACVAEALNTLDDPVIRSRLQCRMAVEQVFAGHPRLALDTVRPALSAADPSGFRAAYAAALAMWMRGEYDAAIATSELGEAWHREHVGDSHQPPEIHLISRALAMAAAGRFEQAAETAQTLSKFAAGQDETELHASAALVRGYVALGTGDLRIAWQAFRSCVSLNRELDDEAAMRWGLAGSALAAVHLGDRPAAVQAIAELLPLERGETLLFDHDLVERARAWTEVAQGLTSAAVQRLGDAADAAAERGLVTAELVLRHDLVGFGVTTAVSRLRQLAASADGPLPELLAAHAAAAGAAPELAKVAENLSEIGANLLARFAATEAAAAYQSVRIPRQAAAWNQRAEALSARTGSARIPALATSGSAPTLTKREREVALLASAGEQTKAIAARLVLSPRTVENHLEHVYLKLGISGRHELAAALAID